MGTRGAVDGNALGDRLGIAADDGVAISVGLAVAVPHPDAETARSATMSVRRRVMAASSNVESARRRDERTRLLPRNNSLRGDTVAGALPAGPKEFVDPFPGPSRRQVVGA